jgi:beta-lactamase superfamily II metal-dependent hydrolase
MCSLRVLSLLALATVAASAAQPLRIWFIDVEGGGATLIVGPSGDSMLVDTGNAPPNDARDAPRIRKAMEDAGLAKIDYLFTTHYDSDHVGGVPAVNAFAHFTRFFDHGDVDTSYEQNRGIEARWQAYQTASAGKRTIVKPGDMIPMKGARIEVVAAAGEAITKPINHGGANPFCAGAAPSEPNKTENSRGTGFLLTYGKFTFLHLGDLTWDQEMKLACPVNQLGHVSLFIASHHGFFNNMSGAPAFIDGIRPEVVVANNGPRKGMAADAYERIEKIPGLEALWQLHANLQTDAAHNAKEEMIANPEPSDQCKAHAITAVAESSGAFTVTNTRNGYARSYRAR